ncbi:SET domain/MYND finger containing protein [Lotmaria passim]
MPRVQAARAAWYAGLELDAYLRQRAWHWAVKRNYALSADYCIRLLNRHPQDTLGLVLGELAGQHTNQDTFAAKCAKALRESCARKHVLSTAELVRVTLPSIVLPPLTPSTQATAEGTSGLPSVKEVLALLTDVAEADAAVRDSGTVTTGLEDESITVHNTEPLSVTQKTVRRACLRCATPVLAELVEPQDGIYGRGLYATRHIPTRQAILAEAPLLVQRYDETKCAHCLAALGPRADAPADRDAFGISCPLCEEETYCSEQCREAAWAQYHACSCSSRNPELAQWSNGMRELLYRGDTGDEGSEGHGGAGRNSDVLNSGSEARAALSCLTVAKICAMATLQQVHPLALPGISCLRGIADYEPATALSEIGALAVALSAALRQPNLYMEEILSLFALLQTNEFFSTSGVALYSALSMLNHSCEPNCALVSLNEHAQRTKPMEKHLVALRPIRDGEQLFITYNAGLTTKLRYEDRKALCAQRHFECFCPLCIRHE